MQDTKFINVDIVTTPPPFWWWISKQFPNASLDKQIFAFGKRIHWAHQLDGQKLSLDLVAHETTHLKQQGFSYMGAIKWWRRYATDPQFRVDMELEACRAQLNAAKVMSKDRNAIHKLARTLASNLSSPVYGNCISTEEAFKKITA